MHAICDGLNDYSYEDTLFSKHMVYLKENKDNFDKSVELNKTMSVMANMIEHFGLHVNTGDEYWKVLHLFLEVILDKSNRATTWNSDRVRIISGALFMLSKIWIRWPSILKTNAILLNFFWYFTSQDSFNSWDNLPWVFAKFHYKWVQPTEFWRVHWLIENRYGQVLEYFVFNQQAAQSIWI